MPKPQPMPAREQIEVELGAHTYEVVPQSLPYIKHHLGPVLASLADENVEAGNVIDIIADKAHEVLGVFIPDLMPANEWQGVDELGAYSDELAQAAPTVPQIRAAIERIADLNGFDLVKSVGKIVDPTVLREMVTNALRDSTPLAWPTSSSPSTPPSPSPTSSTISSPDSPPAGLVRVG